MAEPLSLLEFVRELLSSGHLRDFFAKDPHGALDSYGLGHLTTADVDDALVLVQDTQTASFDRTYDTGHNSIGGGWATPAAHSDGGGGVHFVDKYVTHNFVDDRDTHIDQSVNQTIDTHGKSFYQDLDNHSVTASGDGAVATAGDIRNSDVVTGSNNTVGDHNVDGNGNVVGNGNHAVTGDDATTGFGSGDVGSTTVHGPLHIGDGAAFNAGSGTAAVSNADNSVNDSHNDSSDHSLDNVGNHWTDGSVNDSHNNSSDHSDNSDHSQDNVGNTHVDASDNSTHTIDDAFNHLHL